RDRQPCPAAAREARGSARAAPSATGRCCATTSRASPSRRSGGWRGGGRREAHLGAHLRGDPRPSTPAARPSPPWTSSTRSSARAAPSTASAARAVRRSSVFVAACRFQKLDGTPTCLARCLLWLCSSNGLSSASLLGMIVVSFVMLESAIIY
uniref:Uncharacterized protein n=1 Tax=Aegilops tauschii subsp. strangulata TaxID=200361 RepID=A0A452ZPI5_AEGTS